MDQPLSPLNQGLNPLRAAPLWGQLVSLPEASPAIDSRVAQPVAAPPGAQPLWLALLLPRLQNWRQCNPDPFRGSLVRG